MTGMQFIEWYQTWKPRLTPFQLFHSSYYNVDVLLYILTPAPTATEAVQ